MANESFPPVPPNRAIPKILGILSICFASMLLLGGLCQMGLSIMSPALAKAMREGQKKVDDDVQAQHKAELKKLEDEEKNAKTEEEKAELRDVRKAAAAAPATTKIPIIDITKFMGNRQLERWTWTELLTGILGNVALLVAGIGLVLFKAWGRKLALWVAGFKIVRLIALYGYCAFVIVPPFAQILGQEVGKMMIQQQQAAGRPNPGLTPEFFTKTYVITYTIMCVGMIVIGSIYPALMLWLLNRKSAKAACVSTKMKDEFTEAW